MIFYDHKEFTVFLGESKQKTRVAVWVCRRCTLQNAIHMKRCAVCETPRISNVPTDIPAHYKHDPRRISSTGEPQLTPGDSPDKSDLDTWRCDHCTFSLNPAWAVTCDVCDTPRNLFIPQLSPQRAGDGFTPHGGAATNHNHNVPIPDDVEMVEHDNDVIMGSQPMKSPPAAGTSNHVTGNAAAAMTDEKDLDDKWVCPRCTLVNKQLADICGACGNRKPETPGKPKPISDMWTCKRCTLRNPKTEAYCQVMHYYKMSFMLD